ncbi:MAG TPA: VOC family protein [Acidimicrobiales bacterium]|nr:VOC family protein [Acidimicrobiales bacterium]
MPLEAPRTTTTRPSRRSWSLTGSWGRSATGGRGACRPASPPGGRRTRSATRRARPPRCPSSSAARGLSSCGGAVATQELRAEHLVWPPPGGGAPWPVHRRAGSTLGRRGTRVGTGHRRLHRPDRTGPLWLEALGWAVVDPSPEEFEIRPAPGRLPGLLFVRVPEAKSVKNRLHLDFRPDDRDAEVQRLLALGATRAEVGQGEQSWVVLTDPEGNEFCVLSSRSA